MILEGEFPKTLRVIGQQRFTLMVFERITGAFEEDPWSKGALQV
jgi:hypothetical protein